jgi:hypothetical protein
MPLTTPHPELDAAAAEFLRKMADFVERGQASEVDYARVARIWEQDGQEHDIEYTIRIRVRPESHL